MNQSRLLWALLGQSGATDAAGEGAESEFDGCLAKTSLFVPFFFFIVEAAQL